MKIFPRPLCFLIALSSVLHSAFSAPVISHEQVRIVPRSKPLNIVARVSSSDDPVQSVILHYALSSGASPVDTPMSATGVGVYYGTIPANYLTAKGSLRYYIEAVSAKGEREETRWYTVAIQDPGATIPAPIGVPRAGGGSETAAWVWPTVIVGGGALAVAGAIALADSGGGGSPPPVDPANSGGGGGDLTGRVITRTATDTVNGANPTLPNEVILNASEEIGTRKISSMKVEVNFNPVDGFEESFEILYKGNTVLASGPVFLQTSRSLTLDGSSPAVTMRILTSVPGDLNTNRYTWFMTVTYFLAE